MHRREMFQKATKNTGEKYKTKTSRNAFPHKFFTAFGKVEKKKKCTSKGI